MLNLPINFRRIAAFVGIFILFLLIVEFNTRIEELNRLSDQRDEIRARAARSAQTEIALQTQVAYARSTAAVEEWARTEGHYIREGDQPVIPIGQPGSAPVIAVTPTIIPTPLKNWEVWRQLFFDD